jgi:hypothetical protein
LYHGAPLAVPPSALGAVDGAVKAASGLGGPGLAQEAAGTAHEFQGIVDLLL